MRVLLLSQYYYPEPVEKVHDLARGLVRRGHEVQVITGFPCYPSGQTYAGYRQRPVFREVLDGVKVIRVPQFPDHSSSWWRRALYYLSFALSSAVIGSLKSQPADVVLVYQAALPIGLSGWIVSRLRRMRLVLDLVDLWPESVVASGMLESNLAARFMRRVARFVYGKSDHINVVTEGFRRNLLTMGVPAERMSVIHNWMPDETYACVAPDPELAQREGLADRFNVVFAGNMGPSQDLLTVLEAAALLSDIPQVQFVLVGGGTQYSELVEFSRQQGLKNVLFLGRRAPESMSALYALADVLLVHLKPDSLSDVSIPSKVFAYLASGRPILMAVRGDAEAFMAENRFGIAVPPSNPLKMAESVRGFYGISRDEREEMGRAALCAYKSKYSSPIQIARVEEVLAKVINRHEQQMPAGGA